MNRDFEAEVRSHKAALKAEARYERDVRRAHEEGRTAFCVGQEKEACNLRAGHKRNAWLRGWAEAQRQNEDYRACQAIPEPQKAVIRAKLAEVKTILAESK